VSSDNSEVYRYETAKGGWGFEGEITAEDIDNNGGADPNPSGRTPSLKEAIEKLKELERKNKQ
jgi:hypothetical protein